MKNYKPKPNPNLLRHCRLDLSKTKADLNYAHVAWLGNTLCERAKRNGVWFFHLFDVSPANIRGKTAGITDTNLSVLSGSVS